MSRLRAIVEQLSGDFVISPVHGLAWLKPTKRQTVPALCIAEPTTDIDKQQCCNEALPYAPSAHCKRHSW